MTNKPQFVGECRRVKLNEICTKGKSSLRQKDVFNDGPYSVYGASGVVGTTCDYQNEIPYVAVVKDGAGVGRASACEPMTSVLGTMQALIPNSNVERDYLLHLVRSLRLGEGFSGSTIPHIYFKDYGRIEVPLPSLEAQKQIVSQLGLVEAKIMQAGAQIEQLDQLVKSRFVEMFGDIDETPYEIRCIQDCSERIKDGTHQTPNYVEKSDGGVAFLSSKNVVGGTMDWDTIKYIPLDLHEKLQKRVAPRKGDVLLAKNGTTGVCAIVDRDCVFDIYVSLALIRPLEWMDSTYMWAAINAVKTKEQFDKRLKGIGVPNLHLGEIKQTLIVVPPLALQQEFAAFASQVNKSRFFFLGDERNEVLSILDVVAYVC